MNTKLSQITLKEQTDSTLVDISMNFSFILPRACNFVALLIIIRDMVFKSGREIFVGILEQLDETICGKRKKALKDEGVRFRVSSRRDRKIMTPFGEISFKYRTLEINGKNNAPLLEFLGITTKTRIFPEACENMLKGCLFTSFRKALDLGEGEVSLGSLWNCFQQWGADIRRKEKEVFEFFREGEKEEAESQYQLAVVMIDGIWNQMQKDKRNRKGKPVESPEKKKPGHFELKSCRVMFGKIVDGAWEWTKAKVYANNCSSDAFLKECRDFLDSTLQLYNVPNIYVISDAASWIKKFCNFYPQSVHQLDWWHLWKKVKTLHFFGEDLYREVWGLLTVERLEEAILLIKKAKSELEAFMSLSKDRNYDENFMFKEIQKREKTWLERRHKEVSQLLSYIENNRECIYGVKSLPSNFPPDAYLFGSGPVEKLQGTLFGYRMKKQGKSWSKQGAYHMSGLLCHWFNGDEINNRIDDLHEQKRHWESENKRLESCGSRVSEVASPGKRPPFSAFNALFPILERGKKDTKMHGVLQSIRESRHFAG